MKHKRDLADLHTVRDNDSHAAIRIDWAIRTFVLLILLSLPFMPAWPKDGDDSEAPVAPTFAGYDTDVEQIVVIGHRDPCIDGTYEEIQKCHGNPVLNRPISPVTGAPQDHAYTGINPSPKQKSDPAADNNSNKQTCPGQGAGGGGSVSNPSTSHPVIIATGEKFQVETDFLSNSVYGLSMQRTYRSLGGYGLFGSRWLSTYDFLPLSFSGCDHDIDYPSLCVPHTFKATFPDGTSYTYTHTSTTGSDLSYVVGNSASATGTAHLIPFNSTIVLNRADGVYSYSSSTGRILRVTSISGTLLYQWTYSGTQVTKITNKVGQTVEFTYGSNGLPSTVKDPSGNNWTYTYNTANMLTTVTSPGGMHVRTYYYEDSGDPKRLTGIAFNGVRYSTYSYYSNGKVHVSGLAGAEEQETFVYGTNVTSVTTAAGQSTIYNFVSQQGALKLSAVSRASTTTCAAAAAHTYYDANGWADYTWTGTATRPTTATTPAASCCKSPMPQPRRAHSPGSTPGMQTS